MNIRPFEWHDMPALRRYRNRFIYLDTTRVLTGGSLFVPTGTLLSTLAPGTGIYTFLYQDGNSDSPQYCCQVAHNAGSTTAHLTFLAPDVDLDQAQLAPLFDHLAVPVGERGAMHMVAEVEEQSPVMGILRQAGFGIYARQRIWRLEQSKQPSEPGAWRVATRQDEAAVRFLYANLVPGLVQQVESLPAGRLHGLVNYRGSDLLAYVDLESGLSGVVAEPYIHPDAESSAEALVRLLTRLPSWNSRPVYICVRSYQSWLEPVLDDLCAQAGLQQAVAVRRLAVRRAAPALATTSSSLNNKSTEPTVPVAQIKTRKNL